ncbi:hypothetical protein [Aquincola tertiaricarbonis]|uniref:hypothetical protein n=1 Tax=Aquincola tertiaricarbonis TaxID=391953 RepID=UPI000614C092|nr:hypothetical protein [Aquincola tertiaricarbonis]
MPRLKLHLIRFHGVLTSNAKLRSSVVPNLPPVPEQPAAEAALAARCEVETARAQPHRIRWAPLLKRIFDINMQHCPNCGSGGLKIIAAILERPVIEEILTHLELDQQPQTGAGRLRRGRTEAI